jgi:organic radical activating enzyme
MITISPILEFYITNVCNLTCRGCNRFNNYNFKGHQYWADHALAIEAWSKRLDAPFISILGGEPLLNPDIELWVSNLRRLWPDSEIMIQTNGTYKNYDCSVFWKKYKVSTIASIHDPKSSEYLKKKYTTTINATVFHQSAIIEKNDSYTLHHSDVDYAFSCCDMKHDHTIFNGKLWKCPSMALLPEFDKQFNLQLDPRQRELLYKFQSLNADCSEEELERFITTKDTPIAQCEFCPTDLKYHTALGELRENLPKPIYFVDSQQ